jgi:hypothetical protein
MEAKQRKATATRDDGNGQKNAANRYKTSIATTTNATEPESCFIGIHLLEGYY